MTDAVVSGDVAAAGVAGITAAALAIGLLNLGHFAHIAYFELSELNGLSLDERLIALSNGSAGIEHYERPEYADRLVVLQQELSQIQNAIFTVLALASLGVAIVITGVLLALASPLLLLLPLAAIPPLVTGRRAQAGLDRARDDTAEARRLGLHLFRLATTAGPAKEICVFRLQDELRARHARLWEETTRRLWRAEARAMLLRTVGQLAFAAGYVVAVLVVVTDAISGRRTVGDVVLAITLSAQVNQQVSAAVGLLTDLQRIARAFVLTTGWNATCRRTRPRSRMASCPNASAPGIRLEGVRFRYPGTERDVLERVDLDLPAGSTVAIVGENGAGKTTLVKLLCRFYEPTEGRLLVDGQELARLPLARWRSRIATGFQDFARFEFIARQVVGVGDLPKIDDEPAVLAALGRARADDLVGRLATGLSTQLGKSYADGTELSGGQWQKLALGRAMMREAPLLLILDESTSALDAAEHRC